jgi:hypothetical protein
MNHSVRIGRWPPPMLFGVLLWVCLGSSAEALQLTGPDRTFVIGNADTFEVDQITISLDDSLFPGDEVWVRIPPSLLLTWDVSSPVSSTSSVAITFPTSAALVVTTSDSIASGEVIEISGIRVVALSTSSLHALQVSLGENGSVVGSSFAWGVDLLELTLDQAAFLVGDPPSVVPELVIESRTAGGVNQGDTIRLILPVDFPARWDTTASIQTVGKAASTVSYAGRTARIQVSEDFGDQERVRISGLRLRDFTRPHSDIQLTLSVNAAERPNARGGSLRVGRLSLTIEDQAFLHGDPSTPLGSVGLAESDTASGLTSGKVVRLRLPEGFAGQWDRGTQVTVEPSERLSAVVEYEGREAHLTVVATSLDPGESVTIRGLAVTSFQGVSAPSSITVVANEQNAENARSVGTLRVGRLELVVADQAFLFGDGPTVLNRVTVSEATEAAGLVPGRVIRLRLPAGFVGSWDESASVSLGGVAREKISQPISYEGSAVRLVVTSAFNESDSFTLDGLRVASFTAPFSAAPLALSANEEGTVNSESDGMLRVGRLSLQGASQSFLVGDPISSVATVTITESTEAAGLVAGRPLRLQLPVGFTGSWSTEESVDVGGVAASKLAVQTIADSVVELEVVADFLPGESVTIQGLFLKEFVGAFAAGPLTLMNDLGETNAIADGNLRVGQLTLTMVDQAFIHGNPATDLGILRIEEAPEAAVLTPGRQLRLRLPAGFSGVWENVGTISLGGAGAGKIDNRISIEGDEAVLDVTGTFGRGEGFTVEGLSLRDFRGAATPGAMTLSATEGAAVNAVASGNLRIGHPTLSSVTGADFIVNDVATTLATLTITENDSAAGLVDGDVVRIVIPDGLNCRFDTSVDSIETSGPQANRLRPRVTYSEDDKAVLITVAADLEPSSSVGIFGLRFIEFSSPSVPTGLRLRANDDGFDNHVNESLFGIGQPTLSSTRDYSFVVGDTGAQVDSILITDDAFAPVLTTRRSLRISLPAGSGLSWDRERLPAVTWALTDGDVGRLGVFSIEVGDSVLAAEITQSLSPGARIAIYEPPLRITSAVARDWLRLSLNEGLTEQARDDHWVQVGAPSISFTTPGIFDVDEGLVTLPPLEIREDSIGASITPATDLRLSWPDGSTVIWAGPADGNLNLISSGVSASGAGADRLSGTAVISGDGRDLNITVSSPFDAADLLRLEGLQARVSDVENEIRMALTVTSPLADAFEEETMRIGDPTVRIVADRTTRRDTIYAVGDSIRYLPPLVFHESANAAILNTRDGLLFTLPTTFNGRFLPQEAADVMVTIGGQGAVGQVTSANYLDQRTLQLEITTDFAPGDSLVVEGIAVFPGERSSASDSVSISVLGGRHSVFPISLRVGAPRLSSTVDQSFVVNNGGIGDSTESVATLRIAESDTAAAIVTDDTIVVAIPESLNLQWLRVGESWDVGAIESPITITGSATTKVGRVLIATPKAIQFSVIQDFEPEDRIEVSGLEFTGFQSVSPRSALRLSVTNGATFTATDERTKRIGRPTLASTRSERFIAGFPRSGATTIVPLTVREDPEVGSVDTTVTLRLSVSSGLTWGSESGGPEHSGLAVYDRTSADGLDLVYRVTRPLEGGDSLLFMGLQVNVPDTAAPPSAILLSVNGGVDAVDSESKRISGQPAIDLSGKPEVIIVGDPDLPLRIRLIDNEIEPAFVANDTILLALPAALQAVWRTGVTLEATQQATVVSVSNREIRIAIATDFGAGDSLIVHADMGNFVEATSPVALLMSAVGDTARHLSLSADDLRIGQPRLQSAAEQVFVAGRDGLAGRSFIVDDEPVSEAVAEPFVIRESELVASITAQQDIRVAIPETLAIRWLDSDPQISGSAIGKLQNPPVTLNTRRDTLIIDVAIDFDAGDSIVVSGMRLGGFDRPSRRAPLVLSVNGGRSDNALDSQTKRVGRPTVSVGVDRRYLVGDSDVPLPVIITEDLVESAITPGGDLRLELTSDVGGDNLLWAAPNGRVQAAGSAGSLVQTANTRIESSGKVMVIDVVAPFAAGDTLRLSGLRLAGLQRVAQGDSILSLSVGGDADVDDRASERILIGDLELSTDEGKIFWPGEWPEPIGPISISETSGVPILVAGDTLRVDLGQLDFRWLDPSDTFVVRVPRSGLQVFAADTAFAGDAKVLATVEPAGVTSEPILDAEGRVTFVLLPGFRDFFSGTLSVVGLRGAGFLTPTVDSLGLEVGLGSTGGVTSWFSRRDRNRFAIAQPSLTSSIETFLVGDEPAPLGDMLLTDDPDTPGIAANTLVHLFVPAGLAATWDAEVPLAPSDSIALSTVGETEVVLEVLASPFRQAPIRIDGLVLRDFLAVSANDNIEVGLSRPGSTKPVTVSLEDAIPKRIGRPTVTVADRAVFLSQQAVDSTRTQIVPSAPIPIVTIAEDPEAAALLPGDLIGLEIPDGFPARWDLAHDPSVTGSLRARPDNSSPTVYQFEVTDEFRAGETASVDDLYLRGFDVAAPDTHLSLRVRSTYETPAEQTMRIGSPSLRSEAPQVFVVGDATTAKWPLTIREDNVAAAIVASKDIRLLIPEGLSLRWDPVRGDLSQLLGGSAMRKVSGISYSTDSTAIILDVAEDFLPGDDLIIGTTLDSLRLTDFGGSSYGSLRARLDTIEGFDIVDAGTLFVGAPALESIADQIFVRGQSLATDVYELYPLFLTEDPRVATMRQGNLIRLVLPDSLSWESSDDGSRVTITVEDSIGGVADKIDTTATIHGDTATVRILGTLGPGDRVAITAGLRVRLASQASPGRLGLSVTTSGRIHTEDQRTKWIGRPEIEFENSADYALDVTSILGDGRTGDTTLVTRTLDIRDVAPASALRIGGWVQVSLPEELRGLVRWRASQLRVRLGVDAINDLQLLDDGHVLAFRMPADLSPGVVVRVVYALEAVPPGNDVELSQFVDALMARLASIPGGGLSMTVELSSGPVRIFGRADTTFAEGLQRTMATSMSSIGAYLPVLFGDAEFTTAFNGDLATTSLRFLTWPGRVLPTTRIDQLRIVAGDDVQLVIEPAKLSVDTASVPLWGDRLATLERVSLELTPIEVRRLNRWFDDDSNAEPSLRISAPLLPDHLNDEDAGDMGMVLTPFALPGAVQFAHSARYFRNDEVGSVRVDIENALPGTLARAVLHSTTSVDVLPTTGLLAADHVRIPGGHEEGLYELWLYGAASGGVDFDASLPTVRQFIIDNTSPIVYRGLDATPGHVDSVGLPRELEAGEDGANALLPVPLRPLTAEDVEAAKHLLPVWNRDSLRVTLVDNIEIVPDPGGDTLAWYRTPTDENVGRPLFFQMPTLPRPIRIDLSGVDADGERVPITDASAAGFVAAFDASAENSEVHGDTITVNVAVVPRPAGIELLVPLEDLPEQLTEEGVVVAFRLRVTDRAGNETDLGFNQERVRLLLASAEKQGLLLNKLINFPNPFRTIGGGSSDLGTTIRFVLTAEADVRLRVFDVAGEQLYVADLGRRISGEHLITWSGRDVYGQPLATGVFLALLEVVDGSSAEVERTIFAVNNRD